MADDTGANTKLYVVPVCYGMYPSRKRLYTPPYHTVHMSWNHYMVWVRPYPVWHPCVYGHILYRIQYSAHPSDWCQSPSNLPESFQTYCLMHPCLSCQKIPCHLSHRPHRTNISSETEFWEYWPLQARCWEYQVGIHWIWLRHGYWRTYRGVW